MVNAMKKHELANILLSQNDGDIEVSVDVSIEEDEDTYGNRVFGQVIEWQESPNNKIILLCEEK